MKSSFPTGGFGQIHGSALIEGIDRLGDNVKSCSINNEFPGEGGRGTVTGNYHPVDLRRTDPKDVSSSSSSSSSASHHIDGTIQAAPSFLEDDEFSGEGHQGIPPPLDMPVGSLKDKWRLLPHFLKLRGLMKQHIDSFDYFVNVEMKQIVQVRVAGAFEICLSFCQKNFKTSYQVYSSCLLAYAVCWCNADMILICACVFFQKSVCTFTTSLRRPVRFAVNMILSFIFATQIVGSENRRSTRTRMLRLRQLHLSAG